MALALILRKGEKVQTLILVSILICLKALLQTDRSPVGGKGLRSPSPQLKLSSCRRPWPPDRRPADWILWSNNRDAMVCQKRGQGVGF
jgi:hypothetical protein